MNNRQPVTGHNVHLPQCEHPECAELLRIRAEAVKLKRWDLVNHAEKALTLCPEQRKRWEK